MSVGVSCVLEGFVCEDERVFGDWLDGLLVKLDWLIIEMLDWLVVLTWFRDVEFSERPLMFVKGFYAYSCLAVLKVLDLSDSF